MQVTLILFGQLIDITGSASLVIDAASDTDQLTEHLHQRYPALKGVKYAIAVNKKVISGNTSLTHGATVALLPPFSGG